MPDADMARARATSWSGASTRSTRSAGRPTGSSGTWRGSRPRVAGGQLATGRVAGVGVDGVGAAAGGAGVGASTAEAPCAAAKIAM